MSKPTPVEGTPPGNLDDFILPVPRSLAGDSLWFFAGTTLFLATGGLWNILLARLLGPSGRGTVAVFELTAQFVASIALLGVDSAYIFHIGRRILPPGVVASTSLLLSILLGVTGAAVLLAGGEWLIAAKELQHGPFPALLSLATLTASVATLVGAAYIAANRVREYSVVLGGIGFVKATVLLVAVAVMGATYRAGVVASLATSIFYLLVLTVILLHRRLAPRLRRPSMLVAGRLLSTGVSNYLGSIAQMLAFRLDALLVAGLAGVSEAGQYVIAVGVSEALAQLPSAIAPLLFVRASQGVEMPDKERSAGVYRMAFWITLFFGTLVAVSSPWLIPLVFGRRFAPSVEPLLLLIPGVVLLSTWRMGSMELAGKGRFRYRNATALLGLAVSIVLDLVVIPKYGAAGAALVSSIAYALMTITLLPFLSRMKGVRPSSLFVPRLSDIRLTIVLVRRTLSR
jgi:O-antigen/teichoic acid export membrane protein